MVDNPALWLSVLMNGASLAYTIFSNRGKAAAERVDTVERKLNRAVRDLDATIEERCKALEAAIEKRAMETLAVRSHVGMFEERVIKAEAQLQHMPSKDTTHRIEVAIEKLAGQIGVLGQQIVPLNATCERLQLAMEHKG